MAYPLDIATAAPRPVRLGGGWWMVRPLPLWGLGMLYAFVRDSGGDPNRLDFDRLLSPAGLPTTLYAALRPCHPDFDYEAAIDLAASILGDDRAKLDLIDAAFRRAPTPDAWIDEQLGKPDEADDDAADTDWSRYVYALTRDRSYADAAGMSLDQAHVELSEGKAGEPRQLTVQEAQRLWEGGLSARTDDGATTPEQTPAVEVDESVVPEGATQVEINGIVAWELPDAGGNLDG
jgi:hypothetical protein